MTKLASTPAAASKGPATSTGATKPAAKPPAKSPTTTLSNGTTARIRDGGTLSKEAVDGASNGRIGGLLTSLISWGDEPAADAGKGKEAKASADANKGKEAKPLELGEGQFLRSGASGDKVNQLQEMLNSNGAKLDVDGKFGPDTLAALKKYQGSNGLGSDGVVGPKTLEKLNAPAPDAKTDQKVDSTKGKADTGEAKPVDPAEKAKDAKSTEAATGAEAVDKSKDAKGADKAGEVKPLELGDGQTLRKGASGDKVTQLQEMLNAKGAKLDVDGKFGSDTLAALKKFQGENDLGKDGVVGSKTLEKLNGAAPEGQTAENKPVDRSDETGKTDQTGKTDETGKTDQAIGQGRFKDTRAALDSLPEPLKKYADTFQAAGEKYGVDPRFLAAIARHETGNGTSSAFKNKNNAMGISNRSGPIKMSSVEASIEKMAQGLAKKDGYYKGKTQIGEIGKVYAPSGASNDPTGLNAHWAGGVAKYYKAFGGDPMGQVIFR